MFTRNFWLAKAAQQANRSAEVMGDQTNTGKPKLITVSGAVGSNVYGSEKYSSINTTVLGTGIHNMLASVKQADVSQNQVDSSASASYNHGVSFGSGNTPATIDDYKLSGDVVSGFSVSCKNNSFYEDDGSAAVVRFDYTITNNNDTEITIGEVGIFAESVWKTSNTSSKQYTHHFYMFERTALESPITIPAGGVGQVTYTIQMNYPVT